MSATLSTTRQNVYYHLGDREPAGRASGGSMRVDRIILAKSLELGNRVGAGLDWTASFTTLTAGVSSDISLTTSSTQYSAIIAAKIVETGAIMERVTFAEIERQREGWTSTSFASGDPTQFALWEASAQSIKMRLNAIPTSNRTVSLLTSALPSATVADATTLPFSDLMLRAIEYAAAAEIALAMDDAEAARIGLNKAVVPKWDQAAEKIVQDERARQARIKASAVHVGRILGR